MVGLIALVSIAATFAAAFVLYGMMQKVFRLSLNERLESMAAIAALNFTPEELDKITGEESLGTPTYEAAVKKLQRIRTMAPNMEYAYILRQTEDPNTMNFIADADSLHPDIPEDINHDGKIDDSDEKTHPGDPYDVSEFPEFREAAFKTLFVDPDFTTSQWGIFLAGTAPIQYPDDPQKPTHYAIGLDLNVTQYQELLQQVILPFLLFSAFLLSIISLQAFALRKLWNKQVEQLKEIDKQKDMLISLVSHQLKSPIASLRWGYNDALDEEFGPISEEHKEHIYNQLKVTDNLLELVSLLLDASRIEMGRLQMNKQKQNLGEFFKEILTVIEETAKEKGVQFKYSLPASLGEGTFDKRLTHMTIENLLTNAVKYSPKGTVEMKVDVRGNILYCSVKDTGIGIPKADQEKLFGKMFRANNVGKIEGTGLGLYVAKGAIEQQGGKLWFESIEGKGTTFFVELPI